MDYPPIRAIHRRRVLLLIREVVNNILRMINGVYNFSLLIYDLLMKVVSLFHPKAKLWVNGRKNQKNKLTTFNPTNGHPIIWIHCASLGEFEQGRPIIEKLKSQNPKVNIVLSFYSPSGYEIRENYNLADLVVYLPLDQPRKVKFFVDSIQPTKAIFIKYEIWPNYFEELFKRNIPLYLVSAIFSENQRFFKSSIKKWFTKPLHQVTHFFVQNQTSKELLESIGIANVEVTGDTRFDRVLSIVEQHNPIEVLTAFINEKTAVILGSSWEEDEKLIHHYIQDKKFDFKIIVAPHEIHESRIASILKSFGDSAVLFSSLQQGDFLTKNILIMDNMGMLSKAYASVDIALIGGGFGKGIHNTLEAAAYGIPLLFGPNYHRFQEAKDLIKDGAAVSITNQEEFDQELTLLLANEDLRKSRGNSAQSYVRQGKGATDLIVGFILNNK